MELRTRNTKTPGFLVGSDTDFLRDLDNDLFRRVLSATEKSRGRRDGLSPELRWGREPSSSQILTKTVKEALLLPLSEGPGGDRVSVSVEGDTVAGAAGERGWGA